ncbi:hypothetical protein XELAEV_18031175mg [Xenopus laevis]|uniref:Uncharacterized protein n=1 Tax=Xenopus laevis TaxID=8355 RepID=A0A974CM35_XENLA|nr:hypothetical protein XELAEV_18031175mg [Xenopus laevis]
MLLYHMMTLTHPYIFVNVICVGNYSTQIRRSIKFIHTVTEGVHRGTHLLTPAHNKLQPDEPFSQDDLRYRGVLESQSVKKTDFICFMITVSL